MIFAPDALTDDAFLGGRLRLLQPRLGYRAATDPVLLAAACPAKSGQTVLDLGCGAGTAVLCLAARVPGLTLAGLELQAEYADLARRNAARNGIALEVWEGDALAPPSALRRGFDHVITNPPFYGAGTPPLDAGRAMALQARAPLPDWVRAAARRLVPGGTLTMILGTGMLPGALAGLGPLGSAVVLPLVARDGAVPGRVILRATKGGRAAFRLLAPLILHDGERYSATVLGILREAASISAHFTGKIAAQPKGDVTT